MTLYLALALPTAAGLGKILVFLVMISILIALHEYGHFIVARRNGVRVNEFALGMGPRLLGWTSPRSGTLYTLNLLPIGGYCAMKGEDGKSSEAGQQRDFRASVSESTNPSLPNSRGERATATLERPALASGSVAASMPTLHDQDNFQAKLPLQRLSIVAAGPLMNFIVAIVLLIVSYAVFGIPQLSTTVGAISPNMPAAKAGIMRGDRIVAVNGVPLENGNALVKDIQSSLGKILRLSIDRNGLQSTVALTPVPGPDGLGHTAGVIGFQKVYVSQRVPLGDAIVRSGNEFGEVVAGSLGMIGSLLTHPSTVAGQVSGPVGMAQAAGEVQDLGWGPYLGFAALISISLGIFNLLPIPALDGGRGLFIVIEMLRGKPVDPEKEALVHFGGFAVLIVLMLFVGYHDIAKIVSGKGAF